MRSVEGVDSEIEAGPSTPTRRHSAMPVHHVHSPPRACYFASRDRCRRTLASRTAAQRLTRNVAHGESYRVSVVAAAASKSRERRSKSDEQQKGVPSQRAIPSDPLQAMRAYAAEETLLFSPRVPQAGEDALRVVYSYPNSYCVGITSLGYQLVWAFLATHPKVTVSRCFLDAHEPLPPCPHLLGFSLSWELDYANVLTLLERSGCSLLAEERSEGQPLVFGGGPCLTGNPETYAAFFDVVLLGDGEELLADFVAAVVACRSAGASRKETLVALSAVPGVYVPSLYRVEYLDGGAGGIASITPRLPAVPPSVTKQTYRGKQLAASTVVSPRMAWPDIFMVEVARSCPEQCRFCSASYLTLPFRAPPLDGGLLDTIEAGLSVTNRLGLLGASVTQHPQFASLLDHLLQPRFEGVRLSIASVRAATVTPALAAALSGHGTQSLTVALESGSERLRRVVNKKLTNDEIVACVRAAEAGGLRALKLYGMVGVPGEVEEDVDATIAMLRELRKLAPRLRLTLGCSTFVPKPHTPFQWYGVDKAADARLTRLAAACRSLNVAFRPESYKWSLIQALLSRGDRRLAPLLLAVRGFGDSLGSYRRAFKQLAAEGVPLPPMEWYVHRHHDFTSHGQDVLPWAHLNGPLPTATLAAHAAEAKTLMDAPPDPGFPFDQELAAVELPVFVPVARSDVGEVDLDDG